MRAAKPLVARAARQTRETLVQTRSLFRSLLTLSRLTSWIGARFQLTTKVPTPIWSFPSLKKRSRSWEMLPTFHPVSLTGQTQLPTVNLLLPSSFLAGQARFLRYLSFPSSYFGQSLQKQSEKWYRCILLWILPTVSCEQTQYDSASSLEELPSKPRNGCHLAHGEVACHHFIPSHTKGMALKLRNASSSSNSIAYTLKRFITQFVQAAKQPWQWVMLLLHSFVRTSHIACREYGKGNL